MWKVTVNSRSGIRLPCGRDSPQSILCMGDEIKGT